MEPPTVPADDDTPPDDTAPDDPSATGPKAIRPSDPEPSRPPRRRIGPPATAPREGCDSGQWICSAGAGPSTSGGALSCCPTRSSVNW